MSDGRVATTVADAVKVLRAERLGKVADELAGTPLEESSAHQPVVLVAGEDKRGKSSLVNALLGSPDLSPVGVEVTTGCPISFFFSDPPRAVLVRYGETGPEAVDVDRARSLATVQGNPQNAENIRAIQLGTPSPLLHEFLLVDTPGVGGLNSGHAQLTLQTLPYADALLFVVEAGAQFRSAELAFLNRASSRIDTVVLAMTKTDMHRGWRTIIDDNLEVLRQQAPRFISAPVVPISNVLALRALKTDDPDDAAELLAESGIPELRRVLIDQVARRASVLHQANLLRSTVGPLTVAERSIRERLTGIEHGGASRKGLEDEQARLKKLADDRADWPRLLDREIRRLSLERTEECTRGLVEIRRRYDERIKNPSKEDMKTMPGEFVADLTALAGRLNEMAGQHLVDLVKRVLDDIDTAAAVRDTVGKLSSDSLEERLGAVGLGTTSLTGHEKLSIISMFSTGRSMGGLVSGGGLGVTAASILAPPIGIAIGLGVGALFAYTAFKGRSKQLFAQEFRGWMMEQSQQTQVTVNTTFSREMMDIQEEIRDLVRETLTERERQITEALQETAKILEQAADARQKAHDDLLARLATLQGVRQEVTDTLAALRAGDPGAGDAAPRTAPGAVER